MSSTRQPLSRLVFRSQKSLYVCKSCRSQSVYPRINTSQQQRYASKGDIPLTEKVRRKIWGTDNPPGLADPYGGPSFLEKRKMRREAARKQGEQQQETYTQSQSTLVGDGENLSGGYSGEQVGISAQQDLPPMEDYVPAETTEGLEEIGHYGHWTDLPANPRDDYTSWLNTTSQRASNREELLSCLHQAIVECLACQKANIDPARALLLNPAEVDSDTYATTKITVSPTGGFSTVQFESQAEEQQFIGQLATVGSHTEKVVDDVSNVENSSDADLEAAREAGVEAEIEAEELNEEMPEVYDTASSSSYSVTYYTVHDEAFLSSEVDLWDPLTFHILKRFTQLSGHHIPDPILSSATSTRPAKPFSYLFERLFESVVRPQPKQLAEVLMSKPTLTSQGNVTVLPRRETPIDKQKELGRWKIIERELRSRGLPVTGKLHA